MRTLELRNGDLVISSGELAMIEGDHELAQSVKLTMETARGEWFLNEDFGMLRDPFEAKPHNEEEIRAALIEAATDDERITAVDDLTVAFDRPGRLLSVSMTLQKSDGDTINVEEVTI